MRVISDFRSIANEAPTEVNGVQARIGRIVLGVEGDPPGPGDQIDHIAEIK